MKLDTVFGYLVPKDRKFFPFFIESAGIMVESSELLTKLLREEDLDIRTESVKVIKTIEQKGDNLTRKILTELNGTFITPFEREDIHDLVEKMDSVVDLINGAAKRIDIYNVKRFPKEFIQIADLIYIATQEIQKVLQSVKNVNEFKNHLDACIKISSIESEVDDIYQSYLSNLFEKEFNAIELIKKRDILTSLEKTIDKCDDIGKVFSTLIVKMG